MVTIEKIAFNHFEVNTYVVWDETHECVLVDVACGSKREEDSLDSFLEKRQLKPVKILLTHAHIDHIAGLAFASNKYQLPVSMHKDGVPFLRQAEATGSLMGFTVSDEALNALPKEFIEKDSSIYFGNSVLKVLETPGHAAGSLCFFSEEGKFVITGDVLFKQSIGRTDLPTGDYDSLMKSIKENLLTLPDDTQAFPGHGPASSIGDEKYQNPFLFPLFQE